MQISKQTHSALRLISIGLLISMLISILRTFLIESLLSGDAPDRHEQVIQLFKIAAVAQVITPLTVGTGLLMLMRHRDLAARVAITGGLAFCLFPIIWAAAGFASPDSGLQAFAQAIPWYAYWLAHTIFLCGILAFLWRAEAMRAPRTRLLGMSALVLGLGTIVWIMVVRLQVSESGPPRLSGVFTVVRCLADLSLVGALWFTRPAQPALGMQNVSAAAAGLWQFRSALLARLLVMVFMVIITVIAMLSRSLGMVQIVLVGGTVITMIIGIFMVVGLGRFGSRAPGADAGLLAAFLLGVGVLIDGWMLTIAFEMLSGSPRQAGQASLTLMSAQTVGQLVGIGGMLAVLAGLRGASRALDRPLLARQAGGLMIGVSLLFALALGIRFMLRSMHAGMGVLIAVGVLIFALAVLLKLVGLLSQVAQALESESESNSVSH